MHNKICRI